MGHCRFVRPAVVRLPLTDGEYLDVKKELTASEQRRIFSGLVKTMVAGEQATLDPALVGKTKILEYLVGWSFVGVDGSPAPVNESTIDALDVDTYREVEQAIDAHDAQVEAARVARKNATGGIPASAVISPLPSGADGPSSKSVN